MYTREEVYAVMKSPLFRNTFKAANLLYGIGNWAYAVKLLDAYADTDCPRLNSAFGWAGTKEGWEYWAWVQSVAHKDNRGLSYL